MDADRIRWTYRWMARVYDPLFRRAYAGLRKRSLHGLGLQMGDTVVVVGAGTGLDLPLIPLVGRLLAMDLSKDMLRRASKAPSATPVDMFVGDGARLPLPTARSPRSFSTWCFAPVPMAAHFLPKQRVC